MANSINLKIARESRGFSQKELSQKTRISQATLSKIEKGMVRLTDELVTKIAIALDYPTSFFCRQIASSENSTLFFRKRQSMTAKQLSTLDNKINILSSVIDEMSDSIDIPPLSIPSLSPNNGVKVEEIAFRLRQYLNVSQGPIDNIVSLLEQHGVIVVFLNLGEMEKFDGLTRYTTTNIPVIWINAGMPNDRKRFSLAHELGHLVMHLREDDSLTKSEKELEEEANLFAGEFLMPTTSCRSDFFNLKYKDLALKKAYWKVSKAAIIHRAAQLNCINSKTEKYFYITLGRNGERKNEDGVVSIDEPRMIKKMAQLHLTELEYSMEEFSDLVGLNELEIRTSILGERIPRFGKIILNL